MLSALLNKAFPSFLLPCFIKSGFYCFAFPRVDSSHKSDSDHEDTDESEMYDDFDKGI